MTWDERPEPCCDAFIPAIERQPDTTPISVPSAPSRLIDGVCPVHRRHLSFREYAEQRCFSCQP